MMNINISEILSNPSAIKNFTVEPSFEVLELKRNSYPVAYKEPFILNVQKEAGKIHLKGNTVIDLFIPCDRCLTDVESF